MDYNDGTVKVNKGRQAMWLIGIVVAVAVVFGLVLGPMLRETVTKPPKVGHEHTHDHGGGDAGHAQGEAPAMPEAPPGATLKTLTVDAPTEGGGGDHGHSHEEGVDPEVPTAADAGAPPAGEAGHAGQDH